MRILAVTGGVACGKTTFCRSFAERFSDSSLSYFSCDNAVREISSRASVKSRLSTLGQSYGITSAQTEDKNCDAFRELLFENSDFRSKVEQVLHPLVLHQLNEHTEHLPKGISLLLVEVPLLYEVDFPISRDADFVVAASTSTQIRRLLEQRNLAEVTARQILDSQLPIENKIKRADFVVWNDGDQSSFLEQITHFADRYLPDIA